MKLLRELLEGYPIPLTITRLSGTWPSPTKGRTHSSIEQTSVSSPTAQVNLPTRRKAKPFFKKLSRFNP